MGTNSGETTLSFVFDSLLNKVRLSKIRLHLGKASSQKEITSETD